jgi:hypothetical protein
MDSDPAPSKLGKHGGKRLRGEQACNTRLVYGTVAYWLERLAREGRHDLIAGIKSRQISAHSAAIEIGWLRRRPTISDGDHNVSRRREYAMTQVLDRAPAARLACPELPCLSCQHLNAWRALKELAETYVRARRGEPLRVSLNGTLPLACCQRQRVASVEALIG